MGKGAQHVARRATTFRQGRGGRPPLDFQAEKGQTSGVVAVAEPAPVVGHGGNPPPGPLPDVGGEKGLNNESAAVEGGEGQLPLVMATDHPQDHLPGSRWGLARCRVVELKCVQGGGASAISGVSDMW
jgi:hypothetical protein